MCRTCRRTGGTSRGLRALATSGGHSIHDAVDETVEYFELPVWHSRQVAKVKSNALHGVAGSVGNLAEDVGEDVVNEERHLNRSGHPGEQW